MAGSDFRPLHLVMQLNDVVRKLLYTEQTERHLAMPRCKERNTFPDEGWHDGDDELVNRVIVQEGPDDLSLWHDTTGMWGDSHSHASSCGSRGDGRCRKGRRFGSGQFATAHPEIDCEGDTDERQSGAEFSDDVLGAPGVCGHWIEKAL